MKITVLRKDSYGQERIYPVCEKAKLFAEIAKTKTLGLKDLKAIKNLGYEVGMQNIHTKI